MDSPIIGSHLDLIMSAALPSHKASQSSCLFTSWRAPKVRNDEAGLRLGEKRRACLRCGLIFVKMQASPPVQSSHAARGRQPPLARGLPRLLH